MQTLICGSVLLLLLYYIWRCSTATIVLDCIANNSSSTSHKEYFPISRMILERLLRFALPRSPLSFTVGARSRPLLSRSLARSFPPSFSRARLRNSNKNWWPSDLLRLLFLLERRLLYIGNFIEKKEKRKSCDLIIFLDARRRRSWFLLSFWCHQIFGRRCGKIGGERQWIRSLKQLFHVLILFTTATPTLQWHFTHFTVKLEINYLKKNKQKQNKCHVYASEHQGLLQHRQILFKQSIIRIDG